MTFNKSNTLKEQLIEAAMMYNPKFSRAYVEKLVREQLILQSLPADQIRIINQCLKQRTREEVRMGIGLGTFYCENKADIALMRTMIDRGLVTLVRFRSKCTLQLTQYSGCLAMYKVEYKVNPLVLPTPLMDALEQFYNCPKWVIEGLYKDAAWRTPATIVKRADSRFNKGRKSVATVVEQVKSNNILFLYKNESGAKSSTLYVKKNTQAIKRIIDASKKASKGYTL